jgi:hypothetical protein
VGQPEDLVSVLALLSFAVGNFCRRHRDFRENRGREHQRHPHAILALTKRVAPVDKLSIFSLLASAPHFWARGSRRRISPPSPDGCGALLLIANLKITVAIYGQTS